MKKGVTFVGSFEEICKYLNEHFKDAIWSCLIGQVILEELIDVLRCGVIVADNDIIFKVDHFGNISYKDNDLIFANRIEEFAGLYQVIEWFMDDENGKIAGTFKCLKDAQECAKKCVENARLTEMECRESYIGIYPLMEDESLMDSVEIYHYKPARN